MNNPESGETNQANVEKEHAILDQEFANLKKEQEDLLKELKNGSSEDLLERFKILQEKLEKLKEKIELWHVKYANEIFKDQKGKLLEQRLIEVQNAARLMFDSNRTSFSEAAYEHAVDNNGFRVFEHIGEGASFMRRLEDNTYISQISDGSHVFDTFYYDQGHESPVFSVENLLILSPVHSQVSELSTYGLWASKSNSSDFMLLSSFADYYYTQFGGECYLPGLDAFLYLKLQDLENNETGNILAAELLDICHKKTEGKVPITHAYFIFPGCAMVHFNGEFVFPMLIYNFALKKFIFNFSNIRRQVTSSDFFVLFKK